MQISKFYLPLLKEKPQIKSVISHELMLRAGMIKQCTSGIYSWLPLGLKVLKNVENIIRKNMDEAGFIEILMPFVQNADIWRESGRYEAYGEEMLKFKDRHNHDLLFGPTHEEGITDIVRNNLRSYRDLPKVLYQINWKFRDEIRPRFGIMRGREFFMKDAYSFDIDEESSRKTYDRFFRVYMKTFRDLSLKAIPLAADPGEIGGDMSHEFHVIADTGESEIYFDKRYSELSEEDLKDVDFIRSLYAKTEEKYDPNDCSIDKENLAIKRGIEVAHIFNFGTKYSESMKAYVNNKEGKSIPMQMGSYGIGVSRIVAALIEVGHDDKGIIWPECVAPFKISIINLNIKNEETVKFSFELYDKLKKAGIDVLLDDSKETAGAKFAANDLIGSPWQIIIGPKKLAEGFVELKNRKKNTSEGISIQNIYDIVVKSLGIDS